MSKATKIIILVVICDVFVWSIVGILWHENMNKSLDLKSKKIEVEYGEQISLDPTFYLKKSVDRDVIKRTKVTYESNLEEGKEYDKIGRYTVRLSYEDEVAKVKVTVRDTKKPRFNKISAFETFTDVDIEWSQYISAEDLSKTEVRIDDTDVDISTAGEYTLKAEAEDASGNKAEKEIKVTVNARPADMVDYTIGVDENESLVVVTAIIENNDGTYSNISAAGSSSGGTGSQTNSNSGTSSSTGNERPVTDPSGGEQDGTDAPTEGVTEPTEPAGGGDEQQGSEPPPEESTNGTEGVT
ncbi:immunoglobulin-like domain-containing protein [Gallibacter sp. Marseille-QA0791]|uniref:immunoglobulin-like domain-containing protein n=1 Tax=Gallibacter sp. Marseille-QA0791 TaxID=3378781 RepID=UPI003D0E97AB